MSNRDPKIKKVISALSEGSESLKNNPSAQNRREWEGEIEKAGSSTDWTPYIIAGVIVIICMGAFFIFAGGVAISAASSNNSSSINNEASGYNSDLFKNVYVDQSTNGYGQPGISIHVTFEVNNRKDVPCVILGLFYDEAGNMLINSNGIHVESTGQVAVGYNITPPYDNTEFTDFTLFKPYQELYSVNGGSNLKFQIELHEKVSGVLFAKSSFYSFSIK